MPSLVSKFLAECARRSSTLHSARTAAQEREMPRSGAEKPTESPAPLMDAASGELPKHDPAFVPPAHQLKKYLYAAPHQLHAHPARPTDAKGKPVGKRARVKPARGLGGTADVKLEHHLEHLSATAQAASRHAHEHDDLLLPAQNHGLLETENALERTWRVTQDDILGASHVAAADKRFSLALDQFGPYAVDYTRNGRHLAIAGRRGHVATFDAASSALHSELHLNETVRDVKWLHDESFYAVAQKKYVYIYDKAGLEVHQLRSHIEVNRMEFLPYHFLLATIVSPIWSQRQGFSTRAHLLPAPSGQPGLPQVPRHLDGTARRRAPHETRLVRHHVPEQAQRLYPPRPPERCVSEATFSKD